MLQYYLTIIIQIIMILILISIIPMISLIKKRMKESKMRLPEYKSLNDVITLLDSFISSEFDSYKIMNLEFKDIEYINKEYENEIINEVMNIVMKRISLNILHTLSLYYDKTAINEIIAEKTYFLVTMYVYNINTSKSRAELEMERRKKNM